MCLYSIFNLITTSKKEQMRINNKIDRVNNNIKKENFIKGVMNAGIEPATSRICN